MIDFEKVQGIVVQGLKKYLQCPVIRQNQNAEPPNYPYVSYHISTLVSEYNGTYGEYEDGTKRKPIDHIWSITVQSDKYAECMKIINKAREFFDCTGNSYFDDHDIIVSKVTSVNSRDSLISTEYEYRNGFDVFFRLFDTIEADNVLEEETGTIETVEFNK